MTSVAPQPGVVLVHGAYADGSSWSEVIERLPACRSRRQLKTPATSACAGPSVQPWEPYAPTR